LASGGVLALQCLFIDEIAIDCFLIDAVSLIRFRVDVWVFGLAGPDASCANSRRRYSMTTAGGRKGGGEGEGEGEGESNGESDGEGSIAQLLAEEEQSNPWQSCFPH